MLDTLFELDPTPAERTLDQFWARMLRVPGSPFEAAAAGATGCDRLATVFASGYHGALRHAFGVAADRRTALCVTEAAGNMPKAITTKWDAGKLWGEKTFVTLAEFAEDLLVLAVRGEADGRKDLVLTRLEVNTAGVVLSPTSPLAIVPEITHSRVVFDGASATVVSMDAWPLIKAFRFTEDIFVLGATLAWFLGLARASQQPTVAAQMSSLLLAAAALTELEPASPTAHVAYDGVVTMATLAFDHFDWAGLPPLVQELWTRDRAVLQVASHARAARSALAKKDLGLR